MSSDSCSRPKIFMKKKYSRFFWFLAGSGRMSDMIPEINEGEELTHKCPEEILENETRDRE